MNKKRGFRGRRKLLVIGALVIVGVLIALGIIFGAKILGRVITGNQIVGEELPEQFIDIGIYSDSGLETQQTTFFNQGGKAYIAVYGGDENSVVSGNINLPDGDVIALEFDMMSEEREIDLGGETEDYIFTKFVAETQLQEFGEYILYITARRGGYEDYAEEIYLKLSKPYQMVYASIMRNFWLEKPALDFNEDGEISIDFSNLGSDVEILSGELNYPDSSNENGFSTIPLNFVDKKAIFSLGEEGEYSISVNTKNNNLGEDSIGEIFISYAAPNEEEEFAGYLDVSFSNNFAREEEYFKINENIDIVVSGLDTDTGVSGELEFPDGTKQNLVLGTGFLRISSDKSGWHTLSVKSIKEGYEDYAETISFAVTKEFQDVYTSTYIDSAYQNYESIFEPGEKVYIAVSDVDGAQVSGILRLPYEISEGVKEMNILFEPGTIVRTTTLEDGTIQTNIENILAANFDIPAEGGLGDYSLEISSVKLGYEDYRDSTSFSVVEDRDVEYGIAEDFSELYAITCKEYSCENIQKIFASNEQIYLWVGGTGIEGASFSGELYSDSTKIADLNFGDANYAIINNLAPGHYNSLISVSKKGYNGAIVENSFDIVTEPQVVEDNRGASDLARDWLFGDIGLNEALNEIAKRI